MRLRHIAWLPLAASLSLASARAEVLTSTLLPGTLPQTAPDWHDPAAWDTDPLAPDNGNGGFDYDVVIPAGYVIVRQDATVEDLDLLGSGATRVIPEEGATLTTQGTFTASAVTLGGTNIGRPTLGAVASEGVLTLFGWLELDDLTLINRGAGSMSTGVTPRRILFWRDAQFVNEGTFTFDKVQSGFDLEAPTGHAGSLDNRGTLIVDTALYLSRVTLINSGLVEILDDGHLNTSSSSYVDAGGTLRTQSGGVMARADVPLGRVEGVGAFGYVTLGGTLSPGLDGPGTLTFDRLTLTPGAETVIEVGGTGTGVQSDYVRNLVGQPVLDGNLVVVFIDGFEQSVEAGDVVTIVHNAFGTPIQGSFANVPANGRLRDVTGRVEFTVRYGPGQDPWSISLQDFKRLPPPPPAPTCAGGVPGAPWLLLPVLLAARERAGLKRA